MRKTHRRIIAFVVVVSVLTLQIMLSNPYLTTFYRAPFVASIQNGKVVITQEELIYFMDNPLVNTLRFFDAGSRILFSSLDSEQPFKGDAAQIIAQIHTQRFNPQKPYLVSGGHFSDLYLRNLGIFYGSILDGCIPTDQNDFKNRELITTQSVALALSLLINMEIEPTTLSPLFPNVYVPSNVYTRASDSLYGLLYTLKAMQEPNTTKWMYTNTASCHNLQTQEVGDELLIQNKSTLTRLIMRYQYDVLDPATGLVKKDITLSGARDGVKRESSFYDNVIFWATLKLGTQEGLVHISGKELNNLRNRILAAFWDEKDGLFLNDLSVDALQNKTFSGDEFIVVATRFLDMTNIEDKRKLTKMVAYVEAHNLDKPFPLRYSATNSVSSEYLFVRLGALSYMGDAIWSHWGMEYIKALILIGQKTKAKEFLNIYAQKIKEYGGYPEVYDTRGNILHTFFYKSLLHTGWVINYEETKTLLNNDEKIHKS